MSKLSKLPKHNKTQSNKIQFSSLAKRKTVMIKPEGIMNYYSMEVTKTIDGYSISNYGNKLICGHEFLYHVKNQEDLDRLDIHI